MLFKYSFILDVTNNIFIFCILNPLWSNTVYVTVFYYLTTKYILAGCKLSKIKYHDTCYKKN